MHLSNIITHIEFQKQKNVGDGVFGGKAKYLLKFINLYYIGIWQVIK